MSRECERLLRSFSVGDFSGNNLVSFSLAIDADSSYRVRIFYSKFFFSFHFLLAVWRLRRLIAVHSIVFAQLYIVADVEHHLID